MTEKIIVIDEGTTSTRTMLFAADGTPLGSAQREIQQHYPEPGLVEHDASEIWEATLACTRAMIKKAGGADKVAAIGITNQRETVVFWDRTTGEPLAPAIVWQDRRTAAECARLRAEGWADDVRARTGLELDPYFSATKLAWLLDHVPDARERAERGELAFGTVDSFLIWRMTGGAVHATDATNAARTLLFDIRRVRYLDGKPLILDKNLFLRVQGEIMSDTIRIGDAEGLKRIMGKSKMERPADAGQHRALVIRGDQSTQLASWGNA